MPKSEVVDVSLEHLHHLTNQNFALSNDFILHSKWQRLTANEVRLLVYLLSMIRKEDEQLKKYRIWVKDLCEILDLKHKGVYEEMNKATDGLMTKIIRYMHPESSSFEKISWCSRASMVGRKGYIELRFDPDLKPFLLHLKGHFTSPDVKIALSLKNFYSFRMYLFLKCHNGKGKRSETVELDWLRDYLDIPQSSYKYFGPFKVKILDKAQKILKKNTDIDFTFTPIKKGRKYTSVRFTWKHNDAHLQQACSSNNDYSIIGQKLKSLGFTDWMTFQYYLPSVKDWQLAFDDLEFHIRQRQLRGVFFEPCHQGGWLRNQIKKGLKGEPYKPSPEYETHLEKKSAECEREKRQSDYMRRSQEEKRNRLDHNNQIMAEIDKLPHDERKFLTVAADRRVPDEFEEGTSAYNANFRSKLFELYQNKYG